MFLDVIFELCGLCYFPDGPRRCGSSISNLQQTMFLLFNFQTYIIYKYLTEIFQTYTIYKCLTGNFQTYIIYKCLSKNE